MIVHFIQLAEVPSRTVLGLVQRVIFADSESRRSEAEKIQALLYRGIVASSRLLTAAAVERPLMLLIGHCK